MRLKRRTKVGIVTDADIETHDAAVSTLEGEVADAVGSEPPSFALAGLQGDLAAYAMRWRAWVADNTGVISRALGDKEFAQLRQQYDALRTRWVRLGHRDTKAPRGRPGSGSDTTTLLSSGRNALLLLVAGYLLLTSRK